jgi:hypothetical protein
MKLLFITDQKENILSTAVKSSSSLFSHIFNTNSRSIFTNKFLDEVNSGQNKNLNVPLTKIF